MRSSFALLALAIAGITAAPAMAHTTFINFDDGGTGYEVGAKYAPQGVTFSANTHFAEPRSLAGWLPGSTPPLGITVGTLYMFGADNPIVGTFSRAATRVSIRGLDIGGSGAWIDAFDARGALVGSDGFIGSGGGNGTFADLVVVASGIASFRVYQPGSFNDTNPFLDSIVFDNLSFDLTAVASVPEPASWALMILGVGAVGGALRRRTRPAYA